MSRAQAGAIAGAAGNAVKAIEHPFALRERDARAAILDA
jgi:hypothetical protein